MNEMEDRWLSITEICTYLGVSNDTVYKWIDKHVQTRCRVSFSDFIVKGETRNRSVTFAAKGSTFPDGKVADRNEQDWGGRIVSGSAVAIKKHSKSGNEKCTTLRWLTW